MPAGGNIAHRDTRGVPTLVSGRVLDLEGGPVAGALLDVWQAQTNGLYDAQDAQPDALQRGKTAPEQTAPDRLLHADCYRLLTGRPPRSHAVRSWDGILLARP